MPYKDPEKKRQYDRRYREAHREQVCESNRQYREVHREEIAERMKRYCAAHRTELNARARAWRLANRDRAAENARRWRAANRDKLNAAEQRRKARKAGLPATLTEQGWQEILEEYNHSCAYCGSSDMKLQQEHKTPVSRGGGYTEENIVPACWSCNRRKHTKTYNEFMEVM